jgi:hypothetical protein
MHHVWQAASTNTQMLDKISVAASYVIIVGLMFVTIIGISSGPLHILWW